MLELDADELFEMVDSTFEGRRRAGKDDVLREASRRMLGADGRRAVEALDDRRYTPEELREALVARLLVIWERRRDPRLARGQVSV